jgi:hypothetical protein
LLTACIAEVDINTYATRLGNNVYSLNPSNQGEPFKVFIASKWWMTPNSNTWHDVYAAYFGEPQTN